MSEYVTVWVDELPDLKRGEEIVRCRDCKFFRIGTNTDSCGFTDKYAHPDGFCSWGERKTMDAENVQLGDGEILFIECKFTVEGEETLGDAMKESRISFDGYWPREMFDALADSIKKVVGE